MVLAVVTYVLITRTKGGRQQVPTEHMPETFVVLDLETTSLYLARHEIIEIAAIGYRKGATTHDTFQALVKSGKTVPKEITDLTGIKSSDARQRRRTPVAGNTSIQRLHWLAAPCHLQCRV